MMVLRALPVIMFKAPSCQQYLALNFAVLEKLQYVADLKFLQTFRFTSVCCNCLENLLKV